MIQPKNIMGAAIAIAGLVLAVGSVVPVITSGDPNPYSVVLFLIAMLVLVFAIGIIVSDKMYRMILDWVYGENYQISRPTNDEIVKVHEFAEKHFGGSVTSPEIIKSITEKYRAGLKIAKRDLKMGEVVVGYIFYFPINKKTVDKILKFEFSAAELNASDVASRAKYGYAFYVGAIAAKGFRAKAQMLGALKAYEDLAKQTKSKTIYARAASSDGLRILKKHGFEPVHKKANSVDCFFKKLVK